jgi:hypothetical protein
MSLDRKMITYAAGAAAAGFAGVQSADAAIVSAPGFNFGNGSTTNINFDNSGNEEYVLGHKTSPDPNRVALLKDDQTLDSNAYVAEGGVPAALALGDIIGPGSTFANTYDADLANTGGTGNFTIDNVEGNPDYVGVKFQLADGGPTFFGYIGVDITNANTLAGRVTGFAYETSGESIAAGAVPEPVGLAMLALGAPFLLMRRRQA